MKKNRIIIIGEAGVNHNGDINKAKELIDVAAESKVDFVKFQTFTAKTLVTKNAKKAEYQKGLTRKNETQFKMLKKLELSIDDHRELIAHCEKKNIKFLSTAFDHDSIEVLSELKVPIFKIPSGEITNLPYLKHIGRVGEKVIMSTGMSTLPEVRKAMTILLEQGIRKDSITILHCNTQYPTPMADVNLNAMLTIRDELDVNIGFSDHTIGIEASIAAVAMGASVIEKHFTLNRDLPGPDHAASLEPKELKAMVLAIRNIEIALGSPIKKPSKSEIKNINIVRKSIVAKKQINKGDYFSADNLTIKRPGLGISPMEWDNIIGKRSQLDFDIDDIIEIPS